MEIKRHHLVAFAVLQVLMTLVWVIRIWPRKPPGYITAENTLLCPSPDTLRLVTSNPGLAETFRCKRHPRGVRVYRADPSAPEPPGVWKVYLYDALAAGVPERGWGWRADFLMPDGSAVIDASQA